jgi:hypothetical protein
MAQRRNLKELYRDYNSFDRSLIEGKYSNFERCVMYTGLGLGFFTPVALTRYTLFPERDDIALDLLSWCGSVGLNVFSSALLKGFPLVYSSGIGALAGMSVVFPLKKMRDKRKSENIGLQESLK